MTQRVGDQHRVTRETDIQVRIDLDGATGGSLSTGHGFFDHLLEQLQRHGRWQLSVAATGDLHIDPHHLAEDTGITLGQAWEMAIADGIGIERYGDAFAPMDETLAHVVIDLCGRPHLSFDPTVAPGAIAGFTLAHLREFLRGFANHARVTVHVRLLAGGEDPHHAAEAIMKAFARALRSASRITSNDLPSTKGVL